MFDKNVEYRYNVLNKTAGTVAGTYPFLAR